MASRTHLIIPDPHASPDHNNDRALYLGELIMDIKPDLVLCMGDGPDMPSLSSYDKGKKSFQGRTYKADVGGTSRTRCGTVHSRARRSYQRGGT
jgi:hypothetical protein